METGSVRDTVVPCGAVASASSSVAAAAASPSAGFIEVRTASVVGGGPSSSLAADSGDIETDLLEE